MKTSKLKIEDFISNSINSKDAFSISGGISGPGDPPPSNPLPPSTGFGTPIGPHDNPVKPIITE